MVTLKDCNPNNVPKRKRRTEEEKRLDALGKKLILAKGIKVSDKAELYKIVTGKDYPARRGRPSEARRNFEATIEFLHLMGESTDREEVIIRRIAKSFNLPGSDCDANISEREITNINFNKIFVQQLDKVESYLLQYVDAVDNGLLDDKRNIYKTSKTCLDGLARYNRGNREK